MPLTRRALILSATAASVVAPLASAALSHPSAPLPNGLWRSRSTADLVVFDQRARRTYTCYSSAVALVDESPLEEIERETLDAQLENDSRLELEYWGTVTRFQYDRINDWPTPPPLGNGNWVSDPGMTVDAFFEVLPAISPSPENGASTGEHYGPNVTRHSGVGLSPRTTCSTRLPQPCGIWKTATAR